MFEFSCEHEMIAKGYGNRAEEKCTKHSIFYRNIGNEDFRKQYFLNALISYNLSIAYAVNDIELSLGYANRSIIFLEIEQYEDCLKNIQLARKWGYPEDKMQKLNEREKKCKRMMQQQTQFEDPWSFFKLSHPANAKIPWIVDCLEMRKTNKFGRGIYATKDLKAGDIIAIEEPFIQIPEEEAWYKRCANCFKVANMNLIPCNRSASMMFCSEKCLEDLHAKALNFENIMSSDMKILSELSDIFGGKSQLIDYLTNTPKAERNFSIFDFDLSNSDDQNYRENLAKCFLSLSHNIVIGKGQHASSHCRQYFPNKIVNMILDIGSVNQLKHFQHSDCNGHFYDGHLISLFHGLINHSCISNIVFYPVDQKLVTVVTKPIKAGEQIFRDYTNSEAGAFTHPNQAINTGIMLFSHGFKCSCQECRGDVNYQRCRPICNEPIVITRKYLTKGYENIKAAIYYLNANPKNLQDVANYQNQMASVIQVLAYYCTFPC